MVDEQKKIKPDGARKSQEQASNRAAKVNYHKADINEDKSESKAFYRDRKDWYKQAKREKRD
jgi:hypothetical protein